MICFKTLIPGKQRDDPKVLSYTSRLSGIFPSFHNYLNILGRLFKLNGLVIGPRVLREVLAAVVSVIFLFSGPSPDELGFLNLGGDVVSMCLLSQATRLQKARGRSFGRTLRRR